MDRITLIGEETVISRTTIEVKDAVKIFKEAIDFQRNNENVEPGYYDNMTDKEVLIDMFENRDMELSELVEFSTLKINDIYQNKEYLDGDGYYIYDGHLKCDVK